VTVHCVLKDLGDILGGVCPWGTFVLGQMSGGQQVSGGGAVVRGVKCPPTACKSTPVVGRLAVQEGGFYGRRSSFIFQCERRTFLRVEEGSLSRTWRSTVDEGSRPVR